jgi:D-glycero-alpha-D-manno-heptose-7-phosphate kinase
MKMTKTPLRVSFFGGGTDYPEYFLQHGGTVLASAVDKFSFVIASSFPSKLFDYKIRVSYREVELVKHVDEIEHRVYRECLKKCGILGDIELHNVADLPSFSGMGSSSTFTVGLLHALHAFKDERPTPMELAYEAIDMERNVLHENVGCQDQTLAAVGGLACIEFKKMDDIRVHPLNLPPNRIEELESCLLLVFTRIVRRASDVAAAQLKNMEMNLQTLRMMRAMAEKGANILTGNGNIMEFGAMLHEAWQAKRSLSAEISNDLIDDMYKTARENGAIGGKLLGAGSGGFLLLFAPPESQKKIIKALSAYDLLRIKLNMPGSQVIL